MEIFSSARYGVATVYSRHGGSALPVRALPRRAALHNVASVPAILAIFRIVYICLADVDMSSPLVALRWLFLYYDMI